MYNLVKERLKESMKAKSSSKVFYKNLKNAIDSYSKDNKIDVSDDVVFTVVTKQVKDNLKAIKEYKKHNQDDAIKKLEKENKRYLEFSAPVKTKEETDELINNQFAGLEFGSDFNINRTRGQLMKNLSEYKKELDWNYVVETVNNKLNDLVGTVV